MALTHWNKRTLAVATLGLAVAACGKVKAGGEATVQIEPEDPRTADTLVAAVTGVDPDEVTFRWSVDGEVVSDLTEDTVDDGETAKGEVWTVELVDGGDVLADDETTILNTAPTEPTVEIPARIVAGQPIQCAITSPSEDDDGDTIEISATWTLDGAAFANTATTDFTGDTVLGTETNTDQAFSCTVTVDDGEDTVTGESGTTTVEAPFLFTINDTADTLQRVNLETLEISDIGPLGVAYAFGELAWDVPSQTLFMVDGRGAQQLHTINTETGAATPVGSYAVVDMFGLAYHPPSDQLIGSAPSGLFALNKATGAATLIGDPVEVFDGMAFDTRVGRFVGLPANIGETSFFTVDAANAATAVLNAAGGINNHGMTYDPFSDRFWALDTTGRLIQWDPNTSFTRTEPLTGLGSHTAAAMFIPL